MSRPQLRSRAQRRFAPRLEALESRYTPSCSWNPATNVLTGTGPNDYAYFYDPGNGSEAIYCNGIHVGTASNLNLTFNAGPSTTIKIDDTLAGQQWYSISDSYVLDVSTSGHPKLNFNANVEEVIFGLGVGTVGGPNRVDISPLGGVLTGHPIVSVIGNGPTQMSVDDSGYSGGDSYLITQNQISLPNSLGVIANYSNVEWVFIDTGSGNDTITMKNTAGGSLVAMPAVSAVTGFGSDTVIADSSGYSQGEKYTFRDSVFSYDGELVIEQGANLRRVLFYDADDIVVLQCGPGDDLVTIGDGTLDNLPEITVNGAAGVDTVVGNDSARPTGDSYQLDEYLLLTASKGVVFHYDQNNEYVTLKTGMGDDSISVGHTGNFLLPNITVTVNAGGGIDTLTANDFGDGVGETFHVTDVDVRKESFGSPCVGFDNNLENLTLKTGAGPDTIEVSGSGNMLFDKPLVYVDPGAGTNTLTVDDSGRATDEVYRITESDVSLPNTFGQTVIYPVGKIQTLTLKTGTAYDDITISNSVGTLAMLPDINVDGGSGSTVNTLRVSDAAYLGGDTYNVTNNQVSLPNSLGLIATFSNIYYLWVEVGTGNDTVNIGNTDGTVTGIPLCYVLDLATSDSDVINVHAQNSPSGATYDVEPATHAGVIYAPGWFTNFWFTEQVNLYTGMGDDTINIAKASGQLIDMGVGVFGGGGTNTLSIYDHKNVNAATYTVASSGPGAGSLDVSAPAFAADYQSINVVNLHRSLKVGTVVDKSGYNPADYVLNVFPNRPVGNNPPNDNPLDPPDVVNPPPLPAPPIRDPLAASPAPQIQRVARRATNAVDQSSAADQVFGDYLADPLRSSMLSR